MGSLTFLGKASLMPLKVDEVCAIVIRRGRETVDLLGNDKDHGNELSPDPQRLISESGSSRHSDE